MKALSLLQPWATLVAIKAKRFETRSWRTKYHGPVMIHASKKLTKDQIRMMYHEEPFTTALSKAQRIPTHQYGMCQEDIPLGAVIAVTDLEVCIKIRENLEACGLNQVLERATWEMRFGDYTAGRFAFQFGEVRELKKPVPARGSLGFWNPSQDLIDAVELQLPC